MIGERTQHVFCLPEARRGSGDSAAPTAAGVLASVQAVHQHVLAGQPLAHTDFAVVGWAASAGWWPSISLWQERS